MSQEKKTRRTFLGDSARGAAGAGLTLTAANWNNVLGANDRIRMGIIGAGDRARQVTSHFLKEPGIEFVAICDVYEKSALQTKEMSGGKATTTGDHKALLAMKDVDAVLIATPDHWHASISIDACNAGKDVYVEKPLTWA
ncbi:MAG TPA: Gfo/Idh/MocA family oxidoreductase, partial [Blastocatellia bacterium]|nr:Gfo/Idh/MocA family oxidoreductase [Blastocatellia bacterium]